MPGNAWENWMSVSNVKKDKFLYQIMKFKNFEVGDSRNVFRCIVGFYQIK